MLRVTQLSGFGAGGGAAASVGVIAAAAGSYALSGVTAGITWIDNKTLAAATGSYALTGSLAGLLAGFSGTWVATYSQTLDADSSGWTGYTLRILIGASLLSTSGSHVRATLKASSLAGCSIDACYIGHRAASGDLYDFDGSQVQLKVAGSGSFTIATGDTALTDAATYALDETKDVLVAVHFVSGDVRFNGTGISGVTGYYKGGSNEAATTDVSGYSSNVGASYLVAMIETQ
jgi:hypothetical protein